MADITRAKGSKEISLNTATGTTEELGFANVSGGTIHIPNGSSITSLTYWTRDPINDAYFACYDSDGVAVTQTVAADRSYPIPDACYGNDNLVIVSDASGDVVVTLKG